MKGNLITTDGGLLYDQSTQVWACKYCNNKRFYIELINKNSIKFRCMECYSTFKYNGLKNEKDE